MKHIASVSFGKDSLAMLLYLIENKMPLDEVVFYDTGMEFQAIYNIIHKIIPLLFSKNIKFTILKPEYDFTFKAFEKQVNHRDGTIGYGYSWCGGVCRWGTTDKLQALDKYAIQQNANMYIGIASDEINRIEKERKNFKLLPLAELNMTESDCLKYCCDRGYKWTEKTNDGEIDLYDILDRVSCWCCSNKNLWELHNIWVYLPQYWGKLRDFQSRTNRPMKKKGSVFELEELFINGYIPIHRKKRGAGNEC